MNRPEIAQAIWDAAVSDRAVFIDTVASAVLNNAFMSILDWCEAEGRHEIGFNGWLRTTEGRTYMLLVAEALS